MDESSNAGGPAPGAGDEAGGLPQAPLMIKAQYTKDLSFENPNAPAILTRMTAQPDVHINIGVQTKPLDGNDWEVALEIKADAKLGEETVFIIELVFAGVFEVAAQLADDQKRPLLLIECPRLLFPFARDILGTATRDGGLPPLLLQPIDFVQLYRQKYADVDIEATAGHA